MQIFLVRQLLHRIATIVVIVTATFVGMHALPGDPLQHPQVPEPIRELQARYYGLDAPVHEQYLRYWSNLLQGDLGHSLRHRGRSVQDLIAARFGISATLGLAALAWSLPVGLLLGLWAAARRGGWPDLGAMMLAVIWLAIPSFVAAALLQYAFAVRLEWFPAARWGTFAHAVLPALALGFVVAAVVARLVRTSALEVLQQPYIVTARVKGVTGIRFWVDHVLRNASLALVTVLGPLTASLLAGSVVVEQIFSIPGLGRHLVVSTIQLDYPVIMGITLFYAVLVIGVLFLTDLLYSRLDPRVRVGAEER